MRISDWSSDVCSSDLVAVGIGQCLAAFGLEVQRPSRPETLEDIVRPRAGSDQFRLSRGFEIGAAKAERSRKSSEESRVGTECVRTCRSRWSAYHEKKKITDRPDNQRNIER